MKKRTPIRVDNSWRAEEAAFAIVRILGRDRPKDFEALAQRVCAVGGEDPDRFRQRRQIVEDWCKTLSLSCDWINVAALHLALDPTDEAVGVLRVGVGIDSSGHPYTLGTLRWQSGETKKSFLARAKALFDHMRELERKNGGIVVSNLVPRQHLEWLVRFQVNGESIIRIAEADGKDRRDVSRAVKDVAALLVLTLRKKNPGRPRGRTDRTGKRHIVRR